MKKRNIYLIIVLFFVLAVGFIVSKYKNHEQNEAASFYPLLDRRGISFQKEEWKQVQKKFDDAMKIAATNPDDIKSRIQLASLFITEARTTGNYMYYDEAAMKYINQVLARDPENFEALTFKSLIYLSQHHFADGLAFAEKAREMNPYSAFVYGILVDGNVEMGNYTEAIKDADQMVSIRPDMRSYSRISYLREIHGDYPGAIEAMKMAVEAGPPGDEATEWTRVQLGHLYENVGDMKRAEMNYLISLQYRPYYAYAIAGEARVALSNKDYSKAIDLYLQADSLVNDYSFKEQLADIYQMTGDYQKAEELNKWLINTMKKDAESGRKNENVGHYSDRELAYAYLRIKDVDKALDHALTEYNRRPGNIDVNETVAWVYYNKEEYAKALPYVEVAMKTKSNNPVVLAHAGLIYAKTGDKLRTKTILGKVIDSRANIPEPLMAQVTAAFQQF